MGGMRMVAARILFVLGTARLVLGLFAGLLNREVIDSERFAGHVDSVHVGPRRRAGGGAGGAPDRLLEAAPDLVALRPLVESVSSSVIPRRRRGSVVRSAGGAAAPGDDHRRHGAADPADRRHRGGRDRRAQDHRPRRRRPTARTIWTSRLSQIGASGLDKKIVSTVHRVRVTAWLMPVLALLLLLGSALLRARTWEQVSRTFGRAFLWLGGIVVGVILGATLARC